MSVTYHYILTAQHPIDSGTGTQVVNTSGTITPYPGKTREDVFNHLYEQARERVGVAHLDVLFFALEPNSLGQIR